MKTRQTILTITLIFSSFLINAQDKYQFMIIEFNSYSSQVTVSMDGTELKKEKVDYGNQDIGDYNANPLLSKVKEYQDKEHWEIMGFNTLLRGTHEVYFAFLRKKKTN